MKIYSMTATFGKLEHETLTLKPGLNILEAPNEWGKSTWCAFLVNMLYGIETRARTTKDTLADKERYAPWSGAPMSGRIDLNWNGRDITIQRTTKGRLIFGDFRAYETETGIDIPELTAANCGQMLLGVERSVFTRAGFLKLTDLPVTQDDSLRRRLNDLVTTGDESGDADKLSQTLKDLKNRCRYNKSGLLPQAEAERELLRNQLADLHDLQNKAQAIHSAQAQTEQQLHTLENHKAALRYAASLEDAQRVEAAEAATAQARAFMAEQEAACVSLAPQEDCKSRFHAAQDLQSRLSELQLEVLPQAPVQPAIPARYSGMTPEEARSQAASDAAQEAALTAGLTKPKALGVLPGALLVLAGAGLLFAKPLFGAIGLCLGLLALVTFSLLYSRARRRYQKNRATLDALHSRYDGLSPSQWADDGASFAQAQQEYAAAAAQFRAASDRLAARRSALEEERDQLTGGVPLAICAAHWEQSLAAWDALADARLALARAEHHAQALRAMVKPVSPAAEPDILTFSEDETQRRLNDLQFTQRQLQLELGQCQGRMEALGQEALLRSRLDTLNRRIALLEDYYYALEMAQDALRSATTELQRRFAPRISKRAQALFAQLTQNRYRQISLSSDFTLNASAENEDTLRSAQWRSDGTVDQLYLALRLAVAEELTPEAPLVLDDALVRFDDARLKEALSILLETAEKKQVILFTCQSRETSLLNEKLRRS